MSFTIRWTEISEHKVTLTAQQLADLKRIDVSALADASMSDDEILEGLDDDLANLDDDGFEFLIRDNIEVTAT